MASVNPVYNTLIAFSLAMVGVPLAVIWLGTQVLHEWTALAGDPMVVSAIAAIVVLNCILISYIVMAFNENVDSAADTPAGEGDIGRRPADTNDARLRRRLAASTGPTPTST